MSSKVTPVVGEIYFAEWNGNFTRYKILGKKKCPYGRCENHQKVLNVHDKEDGLCITAFENGVLTKYDPENYSRLSLIKKTVPLK